MTLPVSHLPGQVITAADVNAIAGAVNEVQALRISADPTGAADSTAAVQAAFNAGVFLFPPGDFKLSGDVTVPETFQGQVAGAGSGQTRLNFSSGGLVLPCKGTTGNGYHTKTVRGLSLITSSVGTDTALRIYRTDATSIDTRIVLDDVVAIGSDGVYGTGTGPAHYWGTLLDTQQVRSISVRNSQLHGGGAGKTTYGWRVRTTDTDPQFFVTWDHLSIDGCTKALEVSGWFEGVYGNNFTIFGCRDGISYTHTGTTVGSFSIDNCDIFASRSPLALTNINNVNVGKGADVGRGYVEPGYATAFQDSGVVGNSTDGYHYPGNVCGVSSAGSEGQVTLGGKFFSAFSETVDFLRLTDVNTFSVDGICYGAATGSGLSLLGTTKSGGWDGLVVDARGGTIATAVTIASTCSKIQGGVLVSTATARISDPGDILGAYRAGFWVYPSANLPNVTGDGTFYQVPFNTAQFNIGSGFVTNVFTAPVDGLYQFNANVKLTGILAAHTDASILLVTPFGNRTLETNPFAEAAGTNLTLALSATVKLTAGQTVYVLVTVAGGTKVVAVQGGVDGSGFDGHLVRAL